MFDDDAALTNADIEDGTYIRKARQWYSDIYHVPIAERSFYVIIIVLAILNSLLAVQSFLSIFPLNVKVPFLTYSDDAWADLPIAKKLASEPLEDKNFAVMKHLVKTYIVNRESYDIENYELRYRNIASQSTKSVFDKYKENMDATNLYSPYRIYTNRFKRNINVASIAFQSTGKDAFARIIFYASVVNVFDGREAKRAKFQVDMNFQYSNFDVDQSLEENVWIARLLGLTGQSIKASGDKRKITPMKFVVSGYEVRELLE